LYHYISVLSPKHAYDTTNISFLQFKLF
jgi:hypothetical protein